MKRWVREAMILAIWEGTPAFGSTPPYAAVPARGGPTPRGRRSRARPGVSLLAQGEVWVWLTGSALLMALLMISGLFGFIVWQGSLTFWPVPVVRAQLKDRAHVMGEVSREEQFGLSADALNRLSSESQEAARAFLAGRPTATTRRRLFRTGNFELTQTHYRWVSDFEIQPNSEEQPEWAVAVERLEWGRFFGFPQALVERFPCKKVQNDATPTGGRGGGTRD